MSPSLALHFLGIPELVLDNTPISIDRRKAVALLAYLGMNREKYSREFLSGLLWPEYDQAKAFSNLRRTIWEVHQVIGENWLLADRESIALNRKMEIDLDVAHFQDLLAQSQLQTDPGLRIALLVESVTLYRNHFLTGFSLKDSHPFNEWAYAESEELRRELSEALTTLSKDYRSLGQAEKAIPHARRLISLDPLNESSHRQLMKVYLQAGQHNAALKQYQTCEQILRKELNLDPQPETRELYKKIRTGERKPAHVEKPVQSITSKHNLPSQLSSFIGREKEQDEIINLVAKHRLVTLAGVGGIGKTRLGLQVGQRLISTYPDGVWFIALDSLSDPNLVPQTVAAVFGIQETSNRPVIELLKNMLREKTTLMILDNCEHLLDSCAQLITTLLSNSPELKFLVTSREILNVEGESVYSLPSLAVPDASTLPEQMTTYESVQLFSDRASLALSSFLITNENVQTVIEICRKVDGLPLAIELAAARISVLQVKEIQSQLNEAFALLAGSGRRKLPRQQTLQASMDWSWGLLTESEQIFLRQLSVFAGGWTLESAQAVFEGDGLDLTSALVKKSLIAVKQEVGRETRYRFHEMVRQYMREKLLELGEEEVIRTRHLQYFLQLSERAESALRGADQISWYMRLFEERDNVRTALAWADKTDVERGLYISGRLGRFWESFDIREGSYWLSIFLQKPESKAYPRARVIALHAHLPILNLLNQSDSWQSTAVECIELYRVLGNKRDEIIVLLITSGKMLDAAQRMEFLQQGLHLAQASDDIWGQAKMLDEMGWNSSTDERIACWQRAITLYRQAGDWRSLAHCLGSTANFALLNGDLELAQQSLDEATLLNDELKDKETMATLYHVRAQVAMRRSNYKEARAYWQKGLEITEELGARLNSLWSRSHLGYLALYEGNLTEARDIFTETVQAFFSDKNEIGVVFSLEGMAGLQVAIQKPKSAARLIGWADTMRDKLADTRPLLEQADVDKIITACIIKIGEAAFSGAYDEGKKMSMDQAVALALN